eukprot:2825420-Lingulodinium_polyedra.AAC.1
MAEARVLLEFAAEIYTLQVRAGRHFVHEHPKNASSWAEPCMVKLKRMARAMTVEAGQCELGLMTKGPEGPTPARKPT